MKKSLSGLCLFSLISFGCIIGCQPPKKTGGPYYYKSWATYQVPFKPVGEVAADKIKTMHAYYEAYFNDKGAIEKFTKYLYGNRDFYVTYTYRPDGSLESGIGVNRDGKKNVQHFDSKGKLIIPLETPVK